MSPQQFTHEQTETDKSVSGGTLHTTRSGDDVGSTLGLSRAQLLQAFNYLLKVHIDSTLYGMWLLFCMFVHVHVYHSLWRVVGVNEYVPIYVHKVDTYLINAANNPLQLRILHTMCIIICIKSYIYCVYVLYFVYMCMLLMYMNSRPYCFTLTLVQTVLMLLNVGEIYLLYVYVHVYGISILTYQ